MQHSQAISENVSLKDLPTYYSTEYRLLTALIFTTADCEYMYVRTCGWVSMCMSVYERACVCTCRCAAPELSQVKDGEYQLRPAASFCTKTHLVSQITVKYSQISCLG